MKKFDFTDETLTVAGGDLLAFVALWEARIARCGDA